MAKQESTPETHQFYTKSFKVGLDHVPEFPERTARRRLDEDFLYQVWPTREAMLVNLGELGWGCWKPVQP